MSISPLSDGSPAQALKAWSSLYYSSSNTMLFLNDGPVLPQAVALTRHPSNYGPACTSTSSHEYFVPQVSQASLLPVHYSPSFFLHLLIQPTRLCLVAHSRDLDDPVAFITAALHTTAAPEPRIDILTLGVLPAFQQRQLATRLVRAVVDILSARTAAVAAAIYAQVSASNGPAKNFYRHMGMLPCTDVVRDVYRSLPYGSRDAYIVSGRITAGER
ncbi:hypothetical protein B0H10DRAFT_2230286 [Mycena sp. CBHHK59/15]|nr:hypothetical protein B0H10DRAFT_2230286 [Mycena sp. CBHHK59/15]